MKKSIFVKTIFDQPIKELVKKCDHKTAGKWAADCAERALPYFEQKYPLDTRPRKALEALRTWIQTGIFTMAEVRRDSLAAHAAAREADDDAARSAARAAGQAIATAHVSTHALGAAVYAASAVRNGTGSLDEAIKERAWQQAHLRKMIKH